MKTLRAPIRENGLIGSDLHVISVSVRQTYSWKPGPLSLRSAPTGSAPGPNPPPEPLPAGPFQAGCCIKDQISAGLPALLTSAAPGGSETNRQ